MDYTVAFIFPSTLVCRTTRRVLQRLGFDYPVFEGSREKALEIAEALIQQGTRLVISHGITYQYLRKYLDITMMELPFSGLEAATAVRTAINVSDKVIHMGTLQLYHYLKESLRFFGIDENLLAHYTLNFNRSLEVQAQEALDAGYEVIIGGYPTVNYAIKHGKYGVEFDVDEQIVQTAIFNACSMVEELTREEKKREINQAILQASSEGIIAIDQERNIFNSNMAAERIIKMRAEDCMGKNLKQVLLKNGLVDVHELSSYNIGDTQLTPVVLNELPVMVRGKQEGSVITIKKVTEIQELEYQIRKDLIVKGLVAKHNFTDIVGGSEIMCSVKEKAYTYAKYDSTILIVGETGTGKELFAQSIHNTSNRRNQPFVAINCAALPENLIESELFGYAQGAFTGANREGKKGLFEMANKGTIFLDEISEFPLAMQAKLLRVLQEGEIIRVGGDKVIHIDTRVICSSNKDLLQLVAENRFKSDLYYRLCVLEIKIPPLRERGEDIDDLASNLIDTFNVRHNKRVRSIAPEVLNELRKMRLRGNVRELSNIIERMLLLCNGEQIDMAVFEKSEVKDYTASENPSLASSNLKLIQRSTIERVLEECDGNKTKAARTLGIDPSTLWRKMKN